MLRSTAPIVSARSRRRTLGTGPVSRNASPVRRRSVSILSDAASAESRFTMRRIRSRLTRTTMNAIDDDQERSAAAW